MEQVASRKHRNGAGAAARPVVGYSPAVAAASALVYVSRIPWPTALAVRSRVGLRVARNPALAVDRVLVTGETHDPTGGAPTLQMRKPIRLSAPGTSPALYRGRIGRSAALLTVGRITVSSRRRHSRSGAEPAAA